MFHAGALRCDNMTFKRASRGKKPQRIDNEAQKETTNSLVSLHI